MVVSSAAATLVTAGAATAEFDRFPLILLDFLLRLATAALPMLAAASLQPFHARAKPQVHDPAAGEPVLGRIVFKPTGPIMTRFN
jgi:hypothetical protein